MILFYYIVGFAISSIRISWHVLTGATERNEGNRVSKICNQGEGEDSRNRSMCLKVLRWSMSFLS